MALRSPQRSYAPQAAVMPGLLQRQCACGQHRACTTCSGKQPANDRGVAATVRGALGGGGQPLDRSERAHMEGRFGVDFSAVRIHAGSDADRSAQALNAQAYTVGRDIVFRAGAYAPGSPQGRKLLTHELTHVVQQGAAAGHAPQLLPTAVSHPQDAAEREAVANSERAAGPLAVGQAAGPLVQRDAGLTALGVSLGIAGGVGLGFAIAAGLGAFSSKKYFSAAQANTDGTPYNSDIRLTFTPTSEMNCGEIGFVQAVRHVAAKGGASLNTTQGYTGRMTKAGWTVDRKFGNADGWYGYNNNGTPGGSVSPGSAPTLLIPATMHDRVIQGVSDCSFDFETCAICKAGQDAGKVYSAFHWGFDVDAANHLTSHKTSESGSPSAQFAEAIASWNVQAAGTAPNAPGQKPLGPFK